MAQQANILYLLLCHLNRYLWIEIPGLGIINGRKSSSYVDHIEKKIYPARIVLDFVAANTLRTEIMIQNIISETGYDQELLEEHLAAICQDITESLKENSFFEFIPFGTFNIFNGNVSFLQSPKNIHQEFYAMEAMTIVPVVLPHSEVIKTPKAVPIKKTKSSKEFVFLLIALGVLWLVFLGLLLCPPSSRINKQKNATTPIDSNSTAFKLDSSNLPIDSSLIANDSIAKFKDSISNLVNDTLEPSADTTLKFNNEIVIDSSNIKDLDDKIKYKPCIIVIGSFIKKVNADRLSRKVKKYGYEVYRSEFGKYQRVGIKFNCFEHDLNQMLNELKQKFHPKSWVLKY